MLPLNPSRRAAAPRASTRLLRGCLFEAAGTILHRAYRWSTLKTWDTCLARGIGAKQATAAAAREVAIILHRVLHDGGESRCPAKEAQAA